MNKAHFKAQAYDELISKMTKKLQDITIDYNFTIDYPSDTWSRENRESMIAVKDYLESVLGVTFVWSDNRGDWIPITTTERKTNG